MKMKGYAGSILRIDLSKKDIVRENLHDETARKYLGGITLSAKLLHDVVKPSTDPLSPGNALIASSTPFSGVGLIGTNKTDWSCMSPITNLASTAASGDFGTNLKWAGYDAVVITGKASKPVYITIFDEEVKIKDASHLWGKDIFETSNGLWDQYGDECTIFTIGPAGEKLSKISIGYTNKNATAGRKGSGAVVGSKNIKAIVVRGTKGIRVAHAKKLVSRTDELYAQFLRDPNLKGWMDLGTTISADMYGKEGKPEWKNWSESYPYDRWTKRFGTEAFMKVREISLPCLLCPLSCKVVYFLREDEFAGLRTPQACNMGAILSFGVKFDLAGYNQVVKCHDTANRLGIDSSEFTNVMDFLIEMQEKGFIAEKITDGIKLERNLDTALTWMHKVARREGFGDALADGYPGVFALLGKELEKYSVQRLGLSMDFDPRGLFGTESFGAIVGVTGPHSSFALGPTVIGGRTPEKLKRYCARIGITEKEMDSIFSDSSGFNMGKLTRYIERWNILLNTMGICSRAPLARLYNFKNIAELYYLVTGIEMAPEELLAAAERCENLLKLFNIGQGASRRDDYLPERFYLEPITIFGRDNWLKDYYNTMRLSKKDIDRMLDDYYEERGWDKNGVPQKDTLIALGLSNLEERPL